MTVTAPAAQAGVRPGHSGHRADHLARLARIEGQVRRVARRVARMVEADRYCTDLPTQISAITRALQEVALGLLDDHLRHCVIDAARSDPGEGAQKATELTVAFRRLLRARPSGANRRTQTIRRGGKARFRRLAADAAQTKEVPHGYHNGNSRHRRHRAR